MSELRAQLPQRVRDALDEADTLKEVVVLYEPSSTILEAYGLDDQVGVIAVIPDAAARVEALRVGALDALDPTLPEDELLARLEASVERFRSRLRLEAARDALDRHYQELENDLRLAARLQRSFLPPLPQLEKVRFFCAYLPREFVSGDTYDVRPLGTHHLSLYSMDCVGHGVRAALLTVLLRSVLKPLSPEGEPREPHLVLSDLDAVIREAQLDETPTSAFCYGLLDQRTQTLAIANAGHPLPVRIRADGTSEHLGTSGLLLGVIEDEYETTRVQLEPGDRVFFFSDGVDTDYNEQFLRQLEAHAGLGLSLEDHVGGALGAVVTLDDEGRPEDDVTVLALEVPAHPSSPTGSLQAEGEDPTPHG